MTNDYIIREGLQKASKLPEVEQNALAKWLLEEPETGKEWEKRFAESEDILDRLANEVLESHKKGKTKQIDCNRL